MGRWTAAAVFLLAFPGCIQPSMWGLPSEVELVVVRGDYFLNRTAGGTASVDANLGEHCQSAWHTTAPASLRLGYYERPSRAPHTTVVWNYAWHEGPPHVQDASIGFMGNGLGHRDLDDKAPSVVFSSAFAPERALFTIRADGSGVFLGDEPLQVGGAIQERYEFDGSSPDGAGGTSAWHVSEMLTIERHGRVPVEYDRFEGPCM